MNIAVLFLSLLSSLYVVDCYKILMVFPTPAPSHYILGHALGKGLVNAGHEVTMISAFDEKNLTKNGKYKHVLLTGMLEYFMRMLAVPWQALGEMNPLRLELLVNGPNGIGHEVTNFTTKHPNFQKLIHSNEKFDAIILEQFGNDGLKVLSCHYKIPLISFNTLGANLWSNSLAGNPSPPSYIPDPLIQLTSNMNLYERTINSLFLLAKDLIRHSFFFPKEVELIEKIFPECSKDFNTIIYNVSLTFLNSHESTNQPVPLVPSMIQIGGFHLEPPKGLPDDLQKFMDEATEGVVYFSLGSNLISSTFDPYTKEGIIGALKKLKQRVLWKWDEDIEGLPDNIIIQKWFPQQDILAHPNLKLFVTHGGLLSTIETVYHGVPVLCIPTFGDQILNADKIEKDGYGLYVKFKDISVENLQEAFEKLLNDPKYRENVKRRSTYLRDRPVQPMDLAIYWTEYVIRHKGASHLRVAGLNLEWYQYLLLDVVAVLTTSVFLGFFVVYYLFKLLLRKFSKTNKVKIS